VKNKQQLFTAITHRLSLSSAISLLVFFDMIFKFKFFKKTFEKLSPKTFLEKDINYEK